MKRLLFDSSTNLLYVGIAEDEKLIDQLTRIGKNDHSRHFVEKVHELLKRNNISIGEIEEIIVGFGPGSYTGLRVCVTVSKVLAYTKNIKLSAVSSLYFLSSGIEGKKAPMIDARNNNVFCGIYNGKKTILKDALRDIETFKKEAEKHQAELALLSGENYNVSVAEILKKKEEVKDVHNFTPNYLRKSQAERNLWLDMQL